MKVRILFLIMIVGSSNMEAMEDLITGLEQYYIQAPAIVEKFICQPKGEKQLTLLHAAAMTESPNCVERLLGLGADPDAQDSEGNTPLHLAAMRADEPATLVVESLVRHHAEIHIKNKEQQEPISFCRTVAMKLFFAKNLGCVLPNATSEDKKCRLCSGIFVAGDPLGTPFACGHACHEKCLSLFDGYSTTAAECPVCFIGKMQ